MERVDVQESSSRCYVSVRQKSLRTHGFTDIFPPIVEVGKRDCPYPNEILRARIVVSAC